MSDNRLTCGIVIWSNKEKRIRVCGLSSTHTLSFRGDLLIAICSRHNRRLERALP